MKRPYLAGMILAALELSRLPLPAQEAPLKRFLDDDPTPVRRAIPIVRGTPAPVAPAPAPAPNPFLPGGPVPEVPPAAAPGGTPIPRAIPVDRRRPAATPPSVAVKPVTPRPVVIPQPEDPGTIRMSPNAAPKTADQVQLEFADGYYARKAYDLATTEYQRYLDQFPNGGDRPAALFRLGECQRIRGNTNAAKASYEGLLAQYANGDFIGPAAYRLAELYYQEKEYRDALTMYRKASVRVKEPAVANAAKFFTGRCLEATGQKLEARAVYEDLVATPKDNSFHEASQLSFALLLKDSGRLSEAIKQIQALAKTAENPDLKIEASVRSGLWSLELDPPQTARAEADFKDTLALPGKSYWKEMAQLGRLKILSDASKWGQVAELYDEIKGTVSNDTKPEMMAIAANAQRQLGKTPEALAIFEQASKEFPGSVYDKEAQYERLRVLYSTDDPQLVSQIDVYLQANPETQKRDEAILMKAEVFFRKQDYTNAMPLYSALELSRTLSGNRKAEAIFRLGWCQIKAGNIEQAVKTFTSFMQSFPTNKLVPFALLQRGLAQQSLKRFAEALKDYDELIKSHPKVPQREMALQQKALILGQQGDNTTMAGAFKQLLQEFPETAAKAQANYWIGWAAFEAKSYKNAAPYLSTARDLDAEQFGDKAGIRVLLSQYYLEDLTEAAKEADRYAREGKTKVPSEILRWMGRKFFDGSSYESADKYLQMLIPRDDTMPDDFLLLGDTQLQLGKNKEAVGTFGTYLAATKLPVPRAKGLLALADAQIGLGALAEAQKAVDEALTLQPEGEINGRARIKAGDILMTKGKFEDAAKTYESVAVMLDEPEVTPQALEKAVDAWRKADRIEDADKTLNKLKSRYPEYKQRKLATP